MTAQWVGTSVEALPDDGTRGILVGRAWRPDVAGPSPVAIRDDGVWDVSASFATVRDLCEQDAPAVALAAASGERIGSLDELLANTDPDRRDLGRPWLLAPVDLQAVKAAGVTFAVSMIERVIEERVRGDVDAAALVRGQILERIGGDLAELKPGSPEAAALKEYLIAEGLWSQYLEVGIGPDAEIFTKAQPLSSVGTAAEVGVLATSSWNNPEPEVALVVNSRGRIVGASLANDVNLRDVEGRSALLLSKAKDNNASCAIGPFIRLFDADLGGDFTLDSVRDMTVTLRIEGDDGFVLDASSDMRQISRDPADLVAQLIGPQHGYPDGAVLMLGTMFAPIVDRDAAGKGFTHRLGDVVRISSPALGTLVGRVQHSEVCEPWTFGAGGLMRNLAVRGLL